MFRVFRISSAQPDKLFTRQFFAAAMAVRNPPAAGHTHVLPEGTDDDDDGHPEPIPYPRVNPSRKKA